MDQFQKLDDLIIEHTSPPVQSILRNQLALTREQIEAYQAASDKQDATLQRQLEAIAELQEEKAKLLAQTCQLASHTPFRVSDDYEFDAESGFWIERKTRLKVCARCILPPTNIISPLNEAVGLGFDGEEALVWMCGQCGTNYFYKE